MTPNPMQDPVYRFQKDGVLCDVAFTKDKKHILIRFDSLASFTQII